MSANFLSGILVRSAWMHSAQLVERAPPWLGDVSSKGCRRRSWNLIGWRLRNWPRDQAAGKLQKPGVIPSHRGHITVLDRPRLEQLSCECYAVVKKETDRLLAVITPRGEKIAGWP